MEKCKKSHIKTININTDQTRKIIFTYKISAPTWNEEFELLDGSFSVSDI